MLAKLGKILADPDRTVVGTGGNALVVTRRHVDSAGQPVSGRSTAAPDSTRSNPLNPVEKPSRDELSPAEEQVLRELKERDRDVRQHERKHLVAAGDLARGGARYHYQIGPDGKPYAVGGEVQIDTSTTPGDSETNRRKAERIRRAALAPGDASGPDLAVALQSQAIPGPSLHTRASQEYRRVEALGNAATGDPTGTGVERPNDSKIHELKLYA